MQVMRALLGPYHRLNHRVQRLQRDALVIVQGGEVGINRFRGY
jgi:hypothetical protein